MSATPCVRCGRDLWDEDLVLGTARCVEDRIVCLPCHLGPPAPRQSARRRARRSRPGPRRAVTRR